MPNRFSIVIASALITGVSAAAFAGAPKNADASFLGSTPRPQTAGTVDAQTDRKVPMHIAGAVVTVPASQAAPGRAIMNYGPRSFGGLSDDLLW